VSDEFELLFSMFFIQALSMTIIAFINLLGIWAFPILLKVDFPLGIFNKLNFLFGIACVVFLHIYRLGHAGKVCSGDFLNGEDPYNRDYYLISRGDLLWYYMITFWSVLGTTVVGGIVGAIITVKSLQ
jgi:hypothetical protein